jgi:Domain of unknown function (DUF2382)
MEKRTITAMFDSYGDASKAVQRLKGAGVPESDISLVAGRDDDARAAGQSGTNDDTADDAGKGALIGGALGGGAGVLAGIGAMAIPGLGPVVAAGWLASTLVGATAGAATGGLIGALTNAGLSEEDAHAYAEGIKRGGTLVTARVDDALLDRAVDILDDEGTINMDERETQWRTGGWGGRFTDDNLTAHSGAATSVPSAAPTTAARSPVGASPSAHPTSAGEGSIPVIEEELKVSKNRELNRGRVRVHSHVIERPMEAQVNLRDERVQVERRPTDRPATQADRTLADHAIEMQERTEEPVVAKEARVKEEVRLRKDVDERRETVRDNVKHTEVEVEDERNQQRRPVSGTRDRT